MNDNQDGRQNGRHLSVCSCGHSILVIYYPIASKFHIWITFIKLSPKLEYGLCPISQMAAKMATVCQFALVDTLSHLSPDFFQISSMNYFHQTIFIKHIYV